MCGIAGVYGETDDLEIPLRVMAHRGPDGQLIQQLPGGVIGHTRLAIIDVDGGQQPIPGTGQRWLACNGEIYNAPQLRPQFPDYPFQTYSDNEIILALYDRYGVDAVRHLDGMFAFALADGDDILLARDPIGIKPLYYGWKHGTLHFASEIKAIQDRVERVEVFPPGHFYSSRTGFVRYYDLEQAGLSGQGGDIDPVQRIHDTLQTAVRKRLMADVPLGVYLSGGLDSSIIAALVAQDKPDLHSFAVGVEGSEDMHYARIMSRALGTQHHEYIYTSDEMIAALPDVIRHLESFDPSLVRSAVPNYFLSRMTAEYVTVVLTGEGADELYGGYHYLKQIRQQHDDDTVHREMLHLTASLHDCNLQRTDRMTMAHSLEGRVPFLDTDFIDLAFSIPVEAKIHGPQAVEKYALRQAFTGIMPDEVVWRVKKQFSQGAGSSEMFAVIADEQISDNDFVRETQTIHTETGYNIPDKETLLYYREYASHFDPQVAPQINLWRGLSA